MTDPKDMPAGSFKALSAWLMTQDLDQLDKLLENFAPRRTITIDIERKHVDKVEKKEKDEPAGFLVGLKGGLKALGAFATAMATIIGALLPFAIVLAVEIKSLLIGESATPG